MSSSSSIVPSEVFENIEGFNAALVEVEKGVEEMLKVSPDEHLAVLNNQHLQLAKMQIVLAYCLNTLTYSKIFFFYS